MNHACSVAGCRNKYRAIGFCGTHWKTYKRYGTAEPVCFCGEPAQLSTSHTGDLSGAPLCSWHLSVERYWAQVDAGLSEDCWLWTGAKTTAGYGLATFMGELRYAHRLAFVLNGQEIRDDQQACHTCDVPACVNPNHLYAGDAQTNTNDRVRRKRHTFGETHPSARLTDAQIAEIRTRVFCGESQASIAREFGVHSSHISDIVNMKKRVTPSVFRSV